MESVDVSGTGFHLASLMARMCEEYLPLAETKGIGFETDGPDISMRGNQHLLAMAVSNLVSNAIKFTQRGTVRVSWMESDGEVIIAISDSGIGIRAENRAKVFEKFFKEDADSPGSGIGLPITAEIIARMGGRMDFDSVPGKGSTFRIIIPKEVRR
jgi:signal transduction histidine kinase